MAKWLFAESRILIFDEPTRGIDVGAKFEIYNLIWDLVEGGKGAIVVSSDLPELLGICHRIVVFSKGAVVGELPRERFSEKAVLELAYKNYLDPAHAAPEPVRIQQGRTHERSTDTSHAQGRGPDVVGQPRHHVLACGRRAWAWRWSSWSSSS